jgi:hypothetical protein
MHRWRIQKNPSDSLRLALEKARNQEDGIYTLPLDWTINNKIKLVFIGAKKYW